MADATPGLGLGRVAGNGRNKKAPNTVATVPTGTRMLLATKTKAARMARCIAPPAKQIAMRQRPAPTVEAEGVATSRRQLRRRRMPPMSDAAGPGGAGVVGGRRPAPSAVGPAPYPHCRASALGRRPGTPAG